MRKKYVILACILLFSVFSLIIINAGIADNIEELFNKDNSIKENNVVSRTANSDTSRVNGKFQTTYYSGIVNVEHNGKFIPIEDFINYSESSNGVTWTTLDGKELKFKYYEKEKNKEKTIIENKLEKDKKNLKTNIEKKRGSLYYNITQDKNGNLEEFGFELNSSDEITFYSNYFIWNNFKFDFKQAQLEQNLTYIYNITNKEIKFKDGDLSYIDPSITYNFNATYQNTTMFAKACGTGPIGGGGTSGTNNFNDTDGPLPYCKIPLVDFSTNSALDAVGGTEYGIETGANLSEKVFQEFYAITPYINNDVININWTYRGKQYAGGGGWISLWMWNQSNWISCAANITTTMVTRNCFQNNVNFVNSSNYLHFLAFGDHTGSVDSTVSTDYVSLAITYDDIIINSPTNNKEILNTLSTTLNTSQAGYNSTLWYTWNNGRSNNTLCNDANECQATITFPRQGYYNLTVYGNKSDGTIISKNVNNLFVGNTQIFNVTKDNYIANLDTTNYGTSSNLYAGGISGGEPLRSLLWSNFSAIKNNYIKNVSFYIYLVSGATYANGNLNIYKLNKDWNETSSTWYKLNSSTNWATAGLGSGTDYNSTSLYGLNVGDNKHNIWINFPIGLGLNNEITNELINFGIFLKDTSEDSNNDYRFNSSNAGSSIPYFNVTYLIQNSMSTITNTLSNNSNFSTNSVNFTFNISDDNDYLTNISLFIDNQLNSTILAPTITPNINNSFSFNITGIADGTHTWYIQAYDSDNAQSNSSLLTFTVDTTAPTLNIVYPTDYYTFDHANNLPINYTVSDATIGLSSCWYTNDSSLTNYSITCGNNFTVTESGDGSYQVTIWANDSFNYVINKTIHYTISTLNPIVNLNSPLNNQWLNYKNNVIFNFTFADGHPNSVAELWGNWTGTWEKNQTLTGVANDGSVVNFNPINLLDGNYIWNVFANESNGLSTWNAINWTFKIDTLFPDLTLDHPKSQNYITNTLSINYSTSDLNTLTCKYTKDNGVTNTTLVSCANSSFVASQGYTNFTIYSTDLASNTNSSNVTFFVDSILPSVSITSPANASYFNYNSFIIINLSSSDTNINTCWYSLNNLNTTIVCGNNLSLNVSDESINNLIYYVNDTLNNINSYGITFYADTKKPLVSIGAITTTAGSQTITFNNSVSDAFINNCKYSVFDSSGIIDGLNNNISFTCNSNTAVTVSAFATYNLTIYATDKSGNENSSTKAFTTVAGGGVIQTGGGGGGTVIIGNGNWSITTDSGSNKYTLQLDKGFRRSKQILLKNYAPIALNITLSCEGEYCSYVTLPNKSIYLPALIDIPTSEYFSILIPDDSNVTGFIFNIKGEDQLGYSNILTVDVRSGAVSQFISTLSKALKTKEIFNIRIPYILLAGLLALIFYFIFYYFVFFKLSTKIGFSFLIAILVLILALFLIP